jgi:protein transport protein SEC61 subunit alpha
MELGISPIISGGWVAQILITAGLIKVTSQKDMLEADGQSKLFYLMFCFGEAAGAIWYGAYGQASQMSYVTIFLIMAQLMGAGIVVIMLDDMLSKGYGLGSGISLFIVANTAETLFWFAFSPVTMSS